MERGAEIPQIGVAVANIAKSGAGPALTLHARHICRIPALRESDLGISNSQIPDFHFPF